MKTTFVSDSLYKQATEFPTPATFVDPFLPSWDMSSLLKVTGIALLTLGSIAAIAALMKSREKKALPADRILPPIQLSPVAAELMAKLDQILKPAIPPKNATDLANDLKDLADEVQLTYVAKILKILEKDIPRLVMISHFQVIANRFMQKNHREENSFYDVEKEGILQMDANEAALLLLRRIFQFVKENQACLITERTLRNLIRALPN